MFVRTYIHIVYIFLELYYLFSHTREIIVFSTMHVSMYTEVCIRKSLERGRERDNTKDEKIFAPK